MNGGAASSPASARAARFDDLEIGQDWGVHPWTASPGFCAEWSRITGDSSWTYVASPRTLAHFGGALIPPGLAFVFVAEAIKALMPGRPAGGVHAKQQFTHLAHMRQGETFSTGLCIADKFVKRGRYFVESVTSTRDATGRLLLMGTRLVVWAE
jgi:hypothetical protein